MEVDDLMEGSRRYMYRKWKEWTVILTGSQLLFFRETSLANDLLAHQFSGAEYVPSSEQTFLRPDEIISLKDCIAVYDLSYTKAS